ncbi:unnamed protein product [Durusdinium trenchii]|uniref:Protein kinase domain-containing protein n=1 Tax=Durusdinium trenchii TaxID=1381693 RepID=A0ABP0RHA3_9DINO
MSADERVPALELDPVHMASKLPMALRADELSQAIPGGGGNLQILQQALLVAQHLSRDIGSAQGPQVRIASSKLVVVPNSPAGAEPIFELPLLLCHICLAEDRLAVAPSTTGKYSQLCDVWILKVHGDAARALKILAKYGAVRYDLSAVYVLGSKLSSGSMSSVYRAQLHASEDPSESNVNMKVIPTGGQQAEKRVAQELELQLAAQSHSSVTRLLSVFQVSDHPLGPCCAVAMALTSQNLFDWVFSSSASEPFAAGIMKGLLSGLHHMHQQEIFYRNISPETIQLAPDLKPTYSDFSLATRLAELKRRPIQLGYPGYTAPEILLNMEPTLQSDVFAVGAVLFFMMAKQQPFSELEVGTAVNSCIKQSIQLDQYEDFQASHDLKELLEGLMERSPLARLDASRALKFAFLNQALTPSAPAGDPNARSQRLRQRFVKLLPADQPGGSAEVGDDAPPQEEVPINCDWRLSFSEPGRHEPLVFRRRYWLSGGVTKSRLQIIPFKEIKDLSEANYTMWQTLELDGCLQVSLDALDEEPVELYSPPTELQMTHRNSSLRSGPGPDRITTTQLRAPELRSCFHRQTSSGSNKNLRIDSTSLSPAKHGHGDSDEPARGQPTLWMQHQAQPADQKVNRDMFGTCAFENRNGEDGSRRRLVKKLGVGDQDEEDFDDTASWQSWRSEAMLSSASRASRGRSGSMASCISNASAAAMKELLMQSDDESEKDMSGSHAALHRGSGLRGSSPQQRLSLPQDTVKRQMMLAHPQPLPMPQRDVPTCQFTKADGGRGRRMVKPVGQLNLPGSEEEPMKDFSWGSMADMGRSMSQASIMSDVSFAVHPTPSGDMMKVAFFSMLVSARLYSFAVPRSFYMLTFRLEGRW